MKRGGPARPRGVALGLAVGLALLGTASGACGDGEGEPVTVAREYASAVRSRNVASLLGLLDKAAIEHLENSAEIASDQVGGRRNIEPKEMLQVVETDPLFQVASAELVWSEGDLARVKLIGTEEDETHIVELVREEDAWKVRLPLPPVSSEP